MDSKVNRFLTRQALNLPRVAKRTLAIFLDTLLCILATWIALSLSMEEFIVFNWQYAIPTLMAISIAIPVFVLWNLYRAIFRYSSGRVIRVLAKAITIYAIIYALVFAIIGVQGIPRSIGLMQPMIMFLLVVGSRWLVKSCL